MSGLPLLPSNKSTILNCSRPDDIRIVVIDLGISITNKTRPEEVGGIQWVDTDGVEGGNK